MRRAVWIALLLVACWAAPPIPDPVPVSADPVGVTLTVPRGWEAEHNNDLGRTIVYPGAKRSRDHAVIVQALKGVGDAAAQAGRFKERQDMMLDKIVNEAPHPVGDGGVRFETRREGSDVRKLIYYIDLDGKVVLVDLSAPGKAFDAKLFDAIAASVVLTDA